MSQADDLQRRAEAFADASIAFVQGLPNTMIFLRVGPHGAKPAEEAPPGGSAAEIARPVFDRRPPI
jgi:hypothetical protein